MSQLKYVCKFDVYRKHVMYVNETQTNWKFMEFCSRIVAGLEVSFLYLTEKEISEFGARDYKEYLVERF